jgi:hypothetical protein
MRSASLTHRSLIAIVMFSSVALGCATAAQADKIPPAPVLTLWPDPTYTPDRQCHGGYRPEELDRYLTSARVALWLPGTRSVAVDSERSCLVVTVEDYGDGRLAELVLRGVAVPRHAVLILVG